MPPVFDYIIAEYGSNPFTAMWFLFSHGGALILIPPMIITAWQGWINYIQERFKQRTPYMMLRVQVPQLNEQSMKAVEQIFVQLYGALDVPSREEKYWVGFVQENFSLEIVSKGGYITFYIRTPVYYKPLVESAFYAQYPDALLEETEDYSKELTLEMIQEDKVTVWGSELVLAKDEVYPIKSWPAWEHNLVGRAVDPLAQLLETMTRLQNGENWWFQMMIQPQEHTAFREKAQKVIDEIVEPGSSKTGDPFMRAVFAFLGFWHDLFFPGDYGSGDSGSITLEQRRRLTKPEQELLEEVDRKMSRWPYKTKIRWMYWAPEKLYDASKGRRAMLGALQQYRFINWFQEGSRARVHQGVLRFKYINVERRLKRRARRMMWAYQSRDMSRGEHNGFILTTEELASIYHFPQIEVRAPYVTTATSRGVEPPTQLTFTDQVQGMNDSANVRIANGTGGDIPRVEEVPLADVETQFPIGQYEESVSPVRVQSESQERPQEQPQAQSPMQPEMQQPAQPAVVLEQPTNDAPAEPSAPEPPSNLPLL